MTFINIILLGFLQGLTEFFPISSSGHLMIGIILLGVVISAVVLIKDPVDPEKNSTDAAKNLLSKIIQMILFS